MPADSSRADPGARIGAAQRGPARALAERRCPEEERREPVGKLDRPVGERCVASPLTRRIAPQRASGAAGPKHASTSCRATPSPASRSAASLGLGNRRVTSSCRYAYKRPKRGCSSGAAQSASTDVSRASSASIARRVPGAPASPLRPARPRSAPRHRRARVPARRRCRARAGRRRDRYRRRPLHEPRAPGGHSGTETSQARCLDPPPSSGRATARRGRPPRPPARAHHRAARRSADRSGGLRAAVRRARARARAVRARSPSRGCTPKRRRRCRARP